MMEEMGLIHQSLLDTVEWLVGGGVLLKFHNSKGKFLVWLGLRFNSKAYNYSTACFTLEPSKAKEHVRRFYWKKWSWASHDTEDYRSIEVIKGFERKTICLPVNNIHTHPDLEEMTSAIRTSAGIDADRAYKSYRDTEKKVELRRTLWRGKITAYISPVVNDSPVN